MVVEEGVQRIVALRRSAHEELFQPPIVAVPRRLAPLRRGLLHGAASQRARASVLPIL